MKGKITQWKDDKGFGFIVPEIGGEKLFFHISSVKNQARRPQVGDAVLYDAVRDAQGRLKAKGVVIEGVTSRVGINRNKSVIHAKSVKKDAVNYASMLVAALSFAIGIYVFYTTRSIEKTAPIVGLFIFAVVILNRQKKPKEKWFTCTRCKKTESHGKRTIRARNNGFTKLYCGSCHKKWLQENEEPQSYVSRSGGGCLGVAVLLILLPVATGYGVYQWLI
jgi:cold shock CspA family protein